MKHCHICSTDKDESEFCKRAASGDGLATICRKCQREYDRERRNNPKRIESKKKYSQSEAGKAAANKAKQKWIDKNTVKRAANILVNNCLKNGRLSKPVVCEECACCDSLHGHHDDYAKPLDVRWLCSICHAEWHDKNGEGLNAN